MHRTKVTTKRDDKRANALLDRACRNYKRHLRAVNKAMQDNGRWGVAGLSEPTLVWMLAESLKPLTKAEVKLETTYEDDRRRGDLDVDDPPIWIEARWWWYRRDTLRGILSALRLKISEKAESHSPYALIFTVDSVKEKSWTPGKAEKWLASEARKDGWTLDCAVPVRSTYFGATHTDTTEKHRKGLFVAAFFRLPDQ